MAYQSSNVQTSAAMNAPANQYMTPAPSTNMINARVAAVPQPTPQPPVVAPTYAVPKQPMQSKVAPVNTTIAPISTENPTTPATPVPSAPQGFNMNGIFGIQKAEAQAPAIQTSPIPDGPAPSGYKLTGGTVQNWMTNGASPQAAFSAALNIDQNFKQGVARMSADAKAQGLPSDYTDPVFISRAFKGAYNIGSTPTPNMDLGQLMMALHNQTQVQPPAPVAPPTPQPLGTAPFSNTDYGSSSNPLVQAGGYIGNAASDIKNSLNPVSLIKGVVGSTLGAGKLAGHAVFKAADTLFGTHVEQDLNKIVDNNPNDHSIFGNTLRSLVKGDGDTQSLLNTLKTYGIDKNGISIVDPNNPNKDTMMKGFYEHPLLPALLIGGGLSKVNDSMAPIDAQGNPTGAGPIDQAINNGMSAIKDKVVTPTADVAKSLLNRAQGFTPADTAAAENANAGFQEAVAKPKTTMDLAQPKLTGSAIDQAASDKILAEDGQGNVTGYSGATPKQQAIADELAKVPGIDPNKPGASIAAAKEQIGTLSDQARAELMKTKYPPELPAKTYQSDAITAVRSTLSDAIQTPENSTLFDPTEMKQVQKISNVAENKYAEFLKQAGGETEVAKLDLRQWIDQQVPDAAWSKDLAELPLRTRVYRIFRGAMSDSIDQGAKDIGGVYQPIMDRISNLYKGLDSMRTHLPNSQQSLVDQFTVPSEMKLPNKTPLSPSELVKTGLKKGASLGAKGAAVGVGLGHLSHIIP